MSLTIPADVQQRVIDLLETGRYSSEEEILRAALLALEEQNADLMAIEGGIADMENGRCRPFAEFLTIRHVAQHDLSPDDIKD